MQLKTAILDFTLYNHWSNEVLAGWLKSVDEQLLYREIKSSFPGIDLTLQHMIHAQNFWHAVISNSDINSLDEEVRTGSVDQVIAGLLNGSQNLVDLVRSLDDDDLMSKVSTPAMTKMKFEFVLHVINHNSYHRGQIITIARSLDVTDNFPNTDYDTYLWTRENNSAS